MLVEKVIQTSYFRLSIQVDGQEVGRATLVLIKNDLHEQPYGLLEDLFMHPEHRKQGHGKTLVEAVMARARQEGCYKLIATSRFAREEVHQIYVKIGFRHHGFEFRVDL